MRRSIVVAAAVLTLAAAPQGPDAARILAEMRQAIGGDAAIAAVQGFSVTGTESHSVSGRTASSDVEFLCALPDRFLHIRRWADPIGSTTDEQGFNGNDRIRRRDSDLPYPPEPGQNAAPAEKAQREARVLANAKREFARMAIAMIGVTDIDPVDVSYGGHHAVDGKTADVLVLRAADGYEAKVAIDAATHRPVMTVWMGPPIVTATATTTSVVAVPQGQSPGRMPAAPLPSFPSMPDPLTLPPVEHQLLYQDYKTADGLTWPHKFIERVGGREYSTIKLGKFKLNPKINPKRFNPAR